ncbi:MAG: hypothetical protein QM346_13735 [Chloroflexota bacterium]|nr:hypothetical protein [Chloroflexota bacterium]
MRKEGDTAKQMRADLLGAATGRGAAWAGRLGRQVSAAAQIAATQLGRALRNRTGPGADYRDRISVATWLVVLGLGASLVIDLPTAVVSFWAFGSPITLPFTGAIWFAIFLALTAATGAQSVVAAHPANANRISVLGLENWPYWALPMALTSIAVLLLPLGPSPVIQLAAIALSGALIALAYAGLYATVEPGAPGSRRARLLLDSLAYGSALLLFLFVYQTRTRSLLSGTLVAATAMLLAIEILRSVTPRARVALVYGGIVGLVLGEVTWALNYWVLPGLTGGLLLLLIFYLLIGIAQHGLQGRLTRRVMIEFAVFAVVALILIALVGPGFTLTVS